MDNRHTLAIIAHLHDRPEQSNQVNVYVCLVNGLLWKSIQSADSWQLAGQQPSRQYFSTSWECYQQHISSQSQPLTTPRSSICSKPRFASTRLGAHRLRETGYCWQHLQTKKHSVYFLVCYQLKKLRSSAAVERRKTTNYSVAHILHHVRCYSYADIDSKLLLWKENRHIHQTKRSN